MTFGDPKSHDFPHHVAAPGSEGVQIGHHNIQKNVFNLPSPTPPLPIPAQLPTDQTWFTGRVAEVNELVTLAHDAQKSTAVVIGAIDGMAGVGKTALAVHVAHRIADNFPDGSIFIDLHGFTKGVAPVEPGAALDRMLRALGASGERIPSDLDERAGMWRSYVAGRRLLMVLDNAASEAQVEPLLPGSPGCMVLITSRRRLTGLDAVRVLSLDTLPIVDATTLFRRVTGRRIPDTEVPRSLTEVVLLCGRLPLAIRIAAARLRSRPAWGLTDLVERLRDQRQRLSELDDGTRSVAAAIALSYEQLSPNQRRVYRLLGLHPGPDVDAHAAAALADVAVATARRTLDQLVDVHLLQEPSHGRYSFHDLVRTHAAETATTIETEPDRRAALSRLVDHYRGTAAAAMDLTHPYEREWRPSVPSSRASPDFPDPAAAAIWLDIELPNLLAAAKYAAAAGWADYVWHLSTILHRHLRTRGRYRDAETLHHLALTAARTTGNRAGELDALYGLGHIHRVQGGYDQAIEHFQQALELARSIGNRAREMDVLYDLGYVHRRQSRHDLAANHFQQALELARSIGNRPGELDALYGLGHINRAQGHYDQAIDHFQQALELARITGNRPGELDALDGLGLVHRIQGNHDQAIQYFHQELGLARTTGNRLAELTALLGLADIYRIQHRYDHATEHYQEALQLAQDSGDRNWQFEILQGLGRLHHATGRQEAAVTYHEQALALADELAQRTDQARAHDGLAYAYRALDQHEQARRHWQLALEILTGLGIEHTEDAQTNVAAIQAHLAALDAESSPEGA